MRNEPWNQFKDFSVKTKLLHNLFFKKWQYLLWEIFHCAWAVFQALTEQNFSYP